MLVGIIGLSVIEQLARKSTPRTLIEKTRIILFDKLVDMLALRTGNIVVLPQNSIAQLII